MRLDPHSLLVAVGTMAAVALPVSARADPVTADYSCEGKIRLHVTFDNDKNVAIVESADLGTLTMDAVPTGDGFHYRSGEYQFRGRGNRAAWQVGMNEPFPCVAE